VVEPGSGLASPVWRECLMHISVEKSYTEALDAILAEGGIADPPDFMDVDYFDHYPFYLYISQLDFLSHLPFAEANRVLLKASALYLERLVALATRRGPLAGKTILRMISVADWQDRNDDGHSNYDGTTAYLTPYIWLANLDDPRLGSFTVHPVTTAAGLFVKDALNQDERFRVAEGSPDKFGAPAPEHVYIYMPGSEGTDRLVARSRA
jgi:hypothetical protein